LSLLLGTNVVSEPRRPKPEPRVIAWLRQQDESLLFISALTLGEIAQGAEIRARRDSVAARGLNAWLAEMRTEYSDRVLSITGDIAETWGRLSGRRPLPVIDGLLAATALVHQFTLVTRNVRDFADLGVRLLDPWNP
jgi:predicted nucleic acid-binding protein